MTATLSTTLGEISAITAAGQTFQIYREDGHCLATISDLTTSSTINDMFNRMESYGIQGSINNGIIELYSAEGNYVSGTIMDHLGIGVEGGVSKTYTISKTTTTSTPITFTSDVNAEQNDKISDFITLPSNKTITVYNKEHNAIGSIVVDANTKFDDMISTFSSCGIVTNLSGGILTFTPTDGQYAAGDILTRLGIDTVTTVVTTTSGTTNTGVVVSYTTTHTAEGSTTLATVGINSNSVITVKNADTGATLGTFNISGSTTFDGLSQSLDEYGITLSIVDGVLHLDSDSAYVESTGLAALGITATPITTTVITTYAQSVTGSVVTYTHTTTATGTTTLGSINVAAGTITILNAETNQTIGTFNVTQATTLNDLINSLDNYGINASVVDGIFRVASGDAYAIGAPLTALGITTGYVTTTISTVVTTFGTDCTGSAVTYSVVHTATGSTTLAIYYC